MSYDLYFTSPQISLDQFKRYFANNPLYKIEEKQAWYSNEDTGVYFLFEYNDEVPEDDEIEHSVAFNINYYRPHYFALEAEPEVRKFIDHFGCSIHDYQNEGMGDGPYSKEGFLSGWNHGNDFGYKAILSGDDAPDVIYEKPTDELQKIWKWNCLKRLREQEIQEDIFIPRIMFMLLDGIFGSVCVWPDGISTLIPSVDFLYVPRKVLAPKKWIVRKQVDYCILSRKEYNPVLEPYFTQQFETEVYKLPAPETPKEIKDYVKSLTSYNGDINGVGYDSVLNSELVQKYTNDQSGSRRFFSPGPHNTRHAGPHRAFH